MATVNLLEWSDKQFRLMKTYLPLIVILTMGYWILKQNDQIEKMRSEENDHFERDLQFSREVYIKSQEAYLLIINKK